MDQAHEDDVFDKPHETVVTEVDDDNEIEHRAGKRVSNEDRTINGGVEE